MSSILGTEHLLDQVLPVLRRFLSFDNTSTRSNLDVLGYVEGLCRESSLDVEYLPNGDGTKANLLITVAAADGRTSGGVMFLGHTDTVPVTGQSWSRDPFEPQIIGDRLYARGTADMKAFCACVVAALPQLTQADLREPVHIVLTYDEELGCLGAKNLVDDLSTRDLAPRLCVVGEPTMMKVIRAHKSGVVNRVTFHGAASHSSFTNHGCNAIEYAARAIAFLRGLADEYCALGEQDDSFTVPYSTINVGTVNGGLAVNIVPERCEFEWEMRAIRAEHQTDVMARFDRFLRELETSMRLEHESARVDHETLAEFPGLSPTQESQDLLDALGYIEESASVSYGTEAGLISQLGIPTVVCGPGSIEQAHRADEWVELSQVQRCAASIESLIEHLAIDSRR